MGTSGAVPHIRHRDVHDVLGQVLVGGGGAGSQAGQAGWRTATAPGGSAAYSEDSRNVRASGQQQLPYGQSLAPYDPRPDPA